jgi:localization factor PodJL
LEISRQIIEALPRQAVDSLGFQVEALAERINHSRQSGVDLSVLAAIDHALAEVRDALRNLTTAENLVGFDESIKALAQKVDLIIARQDPAALEQLETAIGALRGIVSHVASNDALNKVAGDVRALAVKVDALTNSAASGHAVSALESRIDALAKALHASAEVGHAMPRELEKLLSALIEKLDWVRLTQTDQAALHHLEDRIAQLIKRLDASDARLGNLEAIERSLADLLVHIDRFRGDNRVDENGTISEPAGVAAIAGDVAEIKHSERRTQDSLEAVHGAFEQVVDRLAMIERDIRDTSTRVEQRSHLPGHSASGTAAKSSAGPAAAVGTAPPSLPMSVPASPAAADVAAGRSDGRRPPIDPNLPPDHPLEPGSAVGPRSPSPAERIAASEPAIGAAKTAAVGEPSDKQNFIVAARRAAQAASAPTDREVRSGSRRRRSSQTTGGQQENNPSPVRKLLVAGSLVLITMTCLEIALHMFQDNRPAAETPALSELPLPSAVLPETASSAASSPAGPVTMPAPGASSSTIPGTTLSKPQDSVAEALVAPSRDAAPPPAPSQAPSPAPTPPPSTPAPAPAASGQPSALHKSTDITGELPSRAAPPPASMPAALPPPESETPKASAVEPVDDELPVTIGGPTLRAAAIAGDTAAEFEIAMRFAQGRGVQPDQQEAAHWLELAAQQGLAPAQFRLGGFYEKGIGVKKDLARARALYLAAAAKGNGKAMHNLAVLYAEGTNGTGDYHTAAIWFRKAAERGITDSQYNLAILYARGSGEQQNYAEAYKWFALAANHGDTGAAEKRDEIASQIDQETLEAADLAVQTWKPEPQPDDAINVKTPPGGWDRVERVAKTKPPLPIAKPAMPESKIK